LVKKICQIGFDQVFGGRAMRRAIQEKIENPIANALLSQQIGKGDKIEIDIHTWQTIITGKIKN
jgi:ATP-dependent Clp protease ATP-binding subunit ClpB